MNSPTSPRATKLPKARVMWAYTSPATRRPFEPWQIMSNEQRYPLGEVPDLPVAVLPLPKTQAAALSRFANLSPEQKVEEVAKSGYMDDVGFRRGEPRWEEYASESPENAICEAWRSRARATLQRIGFLPKGEGK